MSHLYAKNRRLTDTLPHTNPHKHTHTDCKTLSSPLRLRKCHLHHARHSGCCFTPAITTGSQPTSHPNHPLSIKRHNTTLLSIYLHLLVGETWRRHALHRLSVAYGSLQDGMGWKFSTNTDTHTLTWAQWNCVENMQNLAALLGGFLTPL